MAISPEAKDFIEKVLSVVFGMIFGWLLCLQAYWPEIQHYKIDKEMEEQTHIDNGGDMVALPVDYQHLAVFEYKNGEWIRTTKEYPPMPPSPQQPHHQ